MIEIEGVVTDIRFRSEDSNFTVFQLDSEDGLINAVGTIISLSVGDNIRVSGDLVYHKLYGEQIQIRTYQLMMPKTGQQIEKYLSSGIIPFVGERTAKDIVDRFGEDALDIIQENPSRLLEIRGIGEKKKEAIHEAVVKEKESREVFIYLQSLGIGNRMSMQIYKEYGQDSIRKIQENPYRLIDEIQGIGFHIADKIARKNNISKDSEFRIAAGILYYLSFEANNNGNCYLEKQGLLREVEKLLNVDKSLIEGLFFTLEVNGKIKLSQLDGQEVIYLKSIYDRELNIADKAIKLLSHNKLDEKLDLDQLIEGVEEDLRIKYSSMQKEAIRESLLHNMMIITGGPGTGKTTIIKAIIKALDRLNKAYLLAAPTGRAAKRMEESTSMPAQTIHRLLGYKSLQSANDLLEYHEDNPLPADAIIVDEVSMIDIFLMDNLVNALDVTTKLILVGDIDQLPSVGPGNILSDLINSGMIKTIKLDTIFRQGEESNIVLNAHRINKGQQPILNQADKDFFFLRTRSELETLNTVKDLVSTRLPNHYGVDPIKDIQVLAPMKKGICGVEALNKQLQERLNGKEFNKLDLEYKTLIFREGDKVMQIKNNYDMDYITDENVKSKGIYNGDFGFIRNIYEDDDKLEVVFDDKKVVYNNSDLSELNLAYAITIHKSQGSEFPIVVIPLTRGPYMLLTRNIIYTAITRARDLVVLVGDDEVLNRMISNNQIKKRNSSLDYRIRELMEIYEGIFNV